jgi:hypothetical protein
MAVSRTLDQGRLPLTFTSILASGWRDQCFNGQVASEILEFVDLALFAAEGEKVEFEECHDLSEFNSRPHGHGKGTLVDRFRDLLMLQPARQF